MPCILFPITFVLECLQTLFQRNLRVRLRRHERPEATGLVVVGWMFEGELRLGNMLRCAGEAGSWFDSSSSLSRLA
jgi:hypothetical protein